ncbi:ankyrin repeat domain-containing protein [Variovorax sp. OV329]|uniref:ankyrin repeat domain-containing protein n=1 Tax=Variovorax sp. OV329 TaxID=1882825 RepID=UPI0008EA12DF|nr:ankyrin repeat domain-containing protein [Variovorax sp. OV329]SFM62087.1 hypothetical protein SAMN05444747_10718 [Variovorax sp. OV329]
MTKYLNIFIYLLVALGFSLNAHADAQLDYFRAVRADNASGVRSLIESGVNPNLKDDRGQTGFMIAIREPSPKVIEVLLASPKVDVNVVNSADESPLMMAALKGQDELVAKLIARDAAVNKTGWAPLHYAATSGQVAIMKVLLENFAFIDAQSPNGTTPLMMAAMYGSAAAVKLLIDEGADQSMKNQQGMTALDFAKRGNRGDSVELLSRSQAAAPKRPADGKW